MTTRMDAKCRTCGASFAYESRKGQAPHYCSDACRHEGSLKRYREWSQRRRPRQLTTACLTCGAPIMRTLGDHGQPRKFCDRACRSRYRSVQAHGLGDGRYVALLAEQSGGCAICGTTEPGGSFGRNFAIDHCHKSRAVRGLLCALCNQGLGLFKDDPERLRKAADYLEQKE